jgi:hypothetical protein
MPINDGEDVLDALLLLGFSVEIADDGTITATKGAETLRGQAALGTIEWADRSAVYRIRERAYLARLRARVQAGHAAQSAQVFAQDAPHQPGIGREEPDHA